MIADDIRWDEYHKKIHHPEELHSNYAEEKEKFFPRGSMIAELGGGTGADALYFLKKGHSVVLFDISEFALKIAKEKSVKVGLSEKLATRKVDFGLHQLPIKENSIDIVFSRISLNYFDAEHTKKLFRDIFFVLKPGGTAYLTFKSPDDINEIEYFKNAGYEYEENVYIENGQLRSRFTKAQLEKMLSGAEIASFDVNSINEVLKANGHQTTLRLNEIVIRK